jgi:hypothetical protein
MLIQLDANTDNFQGHNLESIQNNLVRVFLKTFDVSYKNIMKNGDFI